MMRVFWLFFAILIGGALAALFMSADPTVTPAITTPSITPPTTDPVQPSPEVAPAPTPVPDAPNEAKEPAPRPASQAVLTIDDRTIRLANQFDVIGRGTREDPFRISWPLLGSARDALDDAGNLTAIPEWLEPLHGFWVEISGYFAPVATLEATHELLVTMNRWDGCCIGLPPTVFDSLALTLDDAITMQGQHLIRFGTIRGELHIEPFSTGGIILGLYRLEHGRITTQGP